MHTNRLVHEKSPYLLQHAHNPVDWYAWGPEAFEKARSEQKPIFLSIGYSTCHWCHVMEHESFESEEIAEVLNRSFVPIKLDREERPDVDRIYMTFVQATTGGGGWPMSVWLTPDLKPFYGGTYFPPDNRYGRPGFRHILEQLASAWESDRARIIESGEEVVRQLQDQVDAGRYAGQIDDKILESGYFQFRRAFDVKLGGFGGAPKFPRAVAYNFLFRYSYLTKDSEAADMVLVTLREMAKGGVNDHLGGGFHRYSVDAKWFVPHFEKMLYDQAQLAVSYLEAFQISGEKIFGRVARDILEYVLRDMTHPGGGFYSAEDADSVKDPSKPEEKGEGAFYVWTAAELDELLGSSASECFSFRYGVEPDGNVHDDPHGEFTRNNILSQRHTLEETARNFDLTVREAARLLSDSKETLLAARNKRIRPHLDDKILTAWNGLMISAFAKGARVLNQARYLEAAQKAAQFTEETMFRDGELLRRYREGDAAIPGFLDDYGYFTQALLDLYEVDFDERHLELANTLTGKMRELFEDQTAGGFYDSASRDIAGVMRLKEDYDGAEPSGNAVAVSNLLRLAHIFGDESYRTSAGKALSAFAGKMIAQPTAMPQMLVSSMLSLFPPKQVVLAGGVEQLQPFLETLRCRFLPLHAILRAGGSSLNWLVNTMPEVNGLPTAYVCENFVCNLPATEISEFDRLLQ